MASNIAKNRGQGQHAEQTGSMVSIARCRSRLAGSADSGGTAGASETHRNPKGRHNPQRTTVRHGVQDEYVISGPPGADH